MMHVLDANELFGITSYTYDRIMEVGGKQGPDAFALYFKLMKQARIQQTNQTYSLNSFLKDGMGWGTDRLRNAKNILKNLGLVDDVNVQDEKGKIIGHYVRVNYLIDEEKVRTAGVTYNVSTCGLGPQMDENHQWTPATCGQTATNALSTKYINAGNTKIENTVPFETFWKEFPHARKGKKAESKKYYEQLDSNDVMKQVAILKRKIKAGLQEVQYIPACERWIRDFTEINEDVIKQDLARICKWHLNAGGDMKERSKELKETFGEKEINEIVKAIQQKDNPKNLFLKP